MVAKNYLEPIVDPVFPNNSYGYRPGKSALDAVGQARKRCWKYDFFIEVDIKGLFHNINHDLLMKAVCIHTLNTWAHSIYEKMVENAIYES